MMSAELTDVQERMMAELVKLNTAVVTRAQMDAERFKRIEDRLSHMETTFGERMTKVEEAANATKDVVEAWTATKASARFLKWILGLPAAAWALAAIKGYLHR